MEGTQPFGKWLRQRRKSLDMTQEDLAERVGYSAATIHMIELGRRKPSRQVAESLVAVLGISEAEREAFLAAARGMAPGESASSAAPPSAQAHELLPLPSTLPAQLTALLGRDKEVATLLSWLRSGARLITLTGPPGIGKTRMAIEVAGLMSSESGHLHPDGIFWVPLAAVTGHEMVIPAIARTLHVEGVGVQPLRETITGFLRQKKMLLLLDNFEHVIDAASDIADLLAECPRLSLLVTSREALSLRGEREFEVSPLRLPDEGRIAHEELMHNPSVALFVERAHSVDRNFTLTQSNAPIVAAICSQLDGLPLAIELVAARTKMLPVNVLLARLQETQGQPHLSLAAGGARDYPGRHKTLREAIGWSYSLLSADEQRLFRRLGVFLGGFTLPAVEAICNSESDLGFDVFEGISQLRQKNLLMREVMSAEQDAEKDETEAQFSMLESIREFALERLREVGEEETLRVLHAEYLLGMASTAFAHNYAALTEDGYAIYRQLDRNEANLHAALTYTIESGRMDMATQFGDSLPRYWELRGYHAEGKNWLLKILSAQAASGILDVSERTKRFSLLMWAVRLSIYMSDNATAQTLLEEAARLGSELDLEPWAAIRTIQHRGLAAWMRGDHVTARSYLEAWVDASVENKLPGANALWMLGIVVAEQGDFEKAKALLNDALVKSREVGDVYASIGETRDLGTTLYYEGKYSEALPMLESALSSALETKFEIGINWTLSCLGLTWLALGDYDRAEQYLRESLVHARKVEKQRIPDSLEGMAEVKLTRARAQASNGVAHRYIEEAATLLGAAEAARLILDISIIPVRAPVRARLITEAAAGLGPAGYDLAYATGKRMGLEEAIQFSL